MSSSPIRVDEEVKPAVKREVDVVRGDDRIVIEDDDEGGEEKPATMRAKEEEVEDDDDEEDDEDDNDEDDDEDDEDEDDDEDLEDQRTGRRKKRRRQGVSRFVDVEAVVDDDEEEYDEEDNELLREDGFIDQDDGADETFQRRTAADNQMLDRKRRREEELDAEQIAAQLNERYRAQRGLTAQSDYEEVPQTLLMPSVNDPGLYSVKCRPGREKIVIQTLLRKALLASTHTPLKIISAFCRDSLPGRVYVEATEPKHVIDACADVAGAYARDNTLFLVPIHEMADLLKITKTTQHLKPGGWVRFKSGKFAGDLAQVIDTSENGETAGLRFIPRLDLDPRDEDVIVDKQGRKRKKGGRTFADRPPPRFFNAEEVKRKFREEPVRRGANTFTFRGLTYINGYCEDDVPIRRLITENVNPTLEEVSRFTGDSINGASGSNALSGQNGVDMALLADAAQRKADIVLRKDDHVVVSEGEQKGVEGVIETVEADVVTLRITFHDLEDQTIEVPIGAVVKRFRPGDHVKVIAGEHRDETGLVVKVEGNKTTFLSDLSMKEISVFSKDIHEAAEVGSGVNTIGGYELHNLVQLDAQTSGVIFKIEREIFMILDQFGAVRSLRPHQITMKRDSTRAVGIDSEGGEFRAGDTMKEVDGEEKEGVVLHVYQTTLVWLFNRDLKENGGVFLTRTRQLRPRAPRGMVKADLSKQNPALNSGLGNGQQAVGGAISNLRRPGGRDPLVGKTVAVIKGQWKTYRGIIKDTNGPTARVELHSISKVLTIGLDHLIEKDPITGQSKPLFQRNSGAASSARPGGYQGGDGGYSNAASSAGRSYGMAATNPYVNGGGSSSSSRTPAHNPYISSGGGGKTPAYGAGGRTPGYNPYVEGGKTPAYNPYVDGGKTPAYNPYIDGGKTPAYTPYNDGGKTPAYTPYSGGGAPANEPRTMAPPSSRRSGGDVYSAPTPMGAPTPGDFSAPTPGAYAAPTPGGVGGAYSAATPGVMYGAPTPGGLGAPTPAGGMLGAPTPAAYGQVPYTPATHSRGGGYGYSVEDGVGNAQNVELLEGILVRIIPSRLNNSSLLEGRHDGKTGYIKALKNNGGSATIGLDDDSWDSASHATLDNVGKEYIEPLRPNAIRAMCLVLAGEHRGKRATVQSLDGEQVLAQVDGKSTFFDITHLARAS